MVRAADLVKTALHGDPGVIDGSSRSIGQLRVHVIIDEHGILV
jgi:hypothetical protein